MRVLRASTRPSAAARVTPPVTLLAEDGKALATTLTDKDGAFQFFDLGESKGSTITWEKPGAIDYDSPVMQGFNVRGGLPIKPQYALSLIHI